MPAVTFSSIFNGVQVFAQGTNIPLNGGLLNTYAAGGSTPTATYSDSGGSVLNSNPIVLGPDGRIPSELWLLASTAYKFVLTDSLGANPVTFDDIAGTVSSVNPVFAGAITAPGINFGSGTTLANYDQGTFTPQLQFGGANVGMTGTFLGRYTLIGDQMTVRITIVLTAKGSSAGNATIINLPVALSASSLTPNVLVGAFSMGALAASACYSVQATAGTTTMKIQSASLLGSDAGSVAATQAAFTNTSVLSFIYIYDV